MTEISYTEGKDNLDVDGTVVCIHCHQSYNFRKSKSSLKMSYCTTMCECMDLGFHLESLERGAYIYMKVPKSQGDTRKFQHLVTPIKKEAPSSNDEEDHEELVLA